MYARHSIEYCDLDSYFLGFSMWNESNECISWEETKYWFDLLGIIPVKELYVGKFDLNYAKNLHTTLDETLVEGYVIRNANKFHYDAFSKNVAKFVRPNHVQTDKHWMQSAIIPNKLKESN